MKTSIIEHILKPANRLRAFASSAIGSRLAIAGLLIFALSWSLVLPFTVHADRRTSGPSQAAPVAPASQPLTQGTEIFTVYGPQRFTQNSSEPVTLVEKFSLPADAVAPFNILVENGSPGGSNRVSKATITLNGTILYKANDFNQSVASLTKPVTLAAT